jgi:TonB family protein
MRCLVRASSVGWARLAMAAGCLAVQVTAAAQVPAAPATPTLAEIRDLYNAASYREALDALDRADAASLQPPDRSLAFYYRGLCLVALKRDAAARAAFEDALTETPLFRPPEEDLSPRVRDVFEQARLKTLPRVAQARYAEGREAFERQQWGEAAAAFDAALAMLDDLGPRESLPQQWRDFRTLAGGFRDLTAASLAAAGTAAAASPPVAPAQRNGTLSRATQPPIAIGQDVPQWPADLPLANEAVAILEVRITASGSVDRVRLRQSASPVYDELLVAAARQWRYEPALHVGRPVSYVKTLRIAVRR